MAQVARDIMSRDVVSLSPGMSIADAADALLHYRIHGAPVVDGTGQLVGMVSFTDLSARHGGTIRDVMTADSVSVSEDTPVDEIAALMLDQMVRRVPVVGGGRVTGIVSASDIIQVFLNLHEPRRTGAETAAPRTAGTPKRGVPRRGAPRAKRSGRMLTRGDRR
ncbi:MAG TPA: CBS domain-containing protein [bacterium]|nr:CBS domain-containing protein [bacterium]